MQRPFPGFASGRTRLRRLRLAACAIGAACFALSAQATEPPHEGAAAPGDAGNVVPVAAVVELFTSQGCSSCPEADKLFETYVNRRDVIAMSLPVDYWDYLGWKDTLASPKNTERQRAYAKARGDGAVYTPQVVVNGIAHAVGSDQAAIERQIARTAMEFARRRVPMRFWRTSSMMVVEAASAPVGVKAGQATIWLATVNAEVDVDIKRGENHGRSLKYFNIVNELTPIGTWSGQPVRLQIASQPFIKPGNMRYAVIMQEDAAGPILGAAWLGW